MNALICLWPLAVLVGLSLSSAFAAEPDPGLDAAKEAPERMVVFRDGTRVLMRVVGGFEMEGRRRVTMEEITRAEFCPVAPGSNLVQFLDLTNGLGAARHRDREAASRRLEASIERFAELARQYAGRTDDPEIRFRLEAALEGSGVAVSSESHIDSLSFRTRNGAMVQWDGDFGAWTATGQVSGVSLKLDRREVAMVHLPDSKGGRTAMAALQAGSASLPIAPGGWNREAVKGSPHLRQLISHEERKGKVRKLAFDKNPEGKELKVGDRVEDAFQAWGCSLSTSVKGGKVVVDSYKVGGESSGFSAANDRPRWEGEITVRFHKPGKPEEPAGVRQAGCYVSSVVMGGISMKFFDLDGGFIGAVRSPESGLAFLGAESEVPIGSVRIVPNPKVDRNYAFDDFYFGPLQLQAPAPARFGVETTRGEIAFGDGLELKDGTWTLRKLSCGLSQWQAPQAQLKSVVFGPGSQGTGDVKLPALVRSVTGAKTVASKIESIADADLLKFGDGVLRLRVDGEEQAIPLAELTAIVFQ